MLETATAPTIAIVAPAGYGKTTLARQWAAVAEGPFIWVQATDAAQDVAVLAEKIVIAAADNLPNCGRRVLERLRATRRPDHEVDVLAELIAEDFSEIRRPTLVIDDYHLVEASIAGSRLVESLAYSGALAVALTTRVRPRWATPRRILYGEILEVGRAALAMTPEEAAEVLDETADERTLGLVALADGWPAVIGLAALSTSTDMPTDVTVHHYLAQELIAHLTPPARSALTILTLTPQIDIELLSTLLGDKQAAEAITEAERIGALHGQGDGSYQLQPLVSAFVVEESERDPPPELAAWLDSAYVYLRERRRWDEAFALVERFDRPHLIEILLREALDDALRGSRFATLSRWIAYSDDAGVSSGVRNLVASELALREGRFLKAEALGRAAAEELREEDPLFSQALRVAGRAAHLASREEVAFHLYRAASDAAKTESDRRKALWGEWSCATDLELESAQEFRRLLGDAIGADICERVMFASWCIAMEARRGHLSSLHLGDEVRDVIDKVDDPLLRCSFRNIYANGLSLSARYGEALGISTELLDDAVAHRLEFVMPYAASSIAQALIGQGDYDQAAWWLVEAHLRGSSSRDIHAVLNALALYARSQIAQGEFGTAFDALDHVDVRGALKSMSGEIAASRALALAGLGDALEASALATAAISMTSAIEPRVLAAATWAVLALGSDREDAQIDELLAHALGSGNLDALVVAYRGVPRLAVRLSQHPSAVEPIAQLAEQVGDGHLIRLLSLRQTGADRASHGISPREWDVYELLAHGASNLEIAQRLFISEATVKAHVHRILEKLSVRTRTEAAVHPAARRFRGGLRRRPD